MTDALAEGMDRPGFAAVPRSLFLPEVIWAHDMASGSSQAISRATHPEEWLAAAETDIPIVTQWDDGAHTGTEPGTVPTSSAAMPSVVASMLHELDVEPGRDGQPSTPAPSRAREALGGSGLKRSLHRPPRLLIQGTSPWSMSRSSPAGQQDLAGNLTP